MDREGRKNDVVVIGGGPAGLAAAIAISRKGLRVLVVERAHAPVDKVCGEGLMPDAVAALRRLGVSLPQGQSVPFRGIRFIDGKTSVEALFPCGSGLGIRRTALHDILIRHANEAGVEILWGATVHGLGSGEVVFGDRRVPCHWIVGADGQNSRVRKWAGLDRSRLTKIRPGYRQHFEAVPWTDLVEVHWGDNFQVVITPVGPRLICAALVSNDPKLRPGDAVASLASLSGRLGDAAHSTKEKGAPSVLRILPAPATGRLALVGDASGSVDSLTGEGLGLAFKQAFCLAEALSEGGLAPYAEAHRKIGRVPTLMSRLLLTLGGYAPLRRRVMRVFARKPQVFARLLETHVGAVAPPVPDVRFLLGLGLTLLRG